LVGNSNFFDRANSAEGAVYETVQCRKDGSRFPVELSVRRVDVEGRPQLLSIVRDITERRRAEAELRASEERYRLIAENTSDVIWLYDLSADAFSYVSPSVLTLRGFQPEEVIGKKLVAALPAESAERINHLLREQMSTQTKGDRSRRSMTIEVDQLHKNGTLVATEVVASFLTDETGRPTHILGITRDITERRRARETLEKFNSELEQRVKLRTAELAARNGELQALLDSIPDTALLFDRSGTVISSHSPENMANSSAHPFENSIIDDSDPVALEIAREIHALALSGNQMVVREFDREKNGSLVSIEARARPAGADRLLILLRDISARKRIEREVSANLERERQLSEMKSQFISVASHEFRTPLAAAVGSLELLDRHADKLTESKRAELLVRIQRSLDRLTTIINDVLKLSRADSGRVTVTRMDVDLDRFVQDIIHDAEVGNRQQHNFSFQPSGRLDPVPADTSLLHHIVSNLVGNAVRYSPPGTTVSVGLKVSDETFSLTVTDEGIGIPKAERERIFEPFVRGSNVGQISGTGLGLNIVKRYTELMGGKIELLPTERGASFCIIVPLHQPSA
jgi:PAS domain S-box-containing protein